ncbi:uncharacterized protein BCR38DRAFT_457112 [Pseudomassariella vexata]|uniref:RING-type E3 ubiquitin transferase n=1 Tax=Pseudomassariella vexata TaxID=1141098 RepID=A0A1Y2E4Z3_9PEZI|nr:uncharacterized protein BCR38DRAFT_457112 [Pseudomassariella vexata]ORY66621.1 hypothetical protein BCR38DRAFT_457112 [Pseudomassariella vexata]
MSASLSLEDEVRYTEIIDGILATANLETVTRKKIRVGLEAALGGKDLTDQKAAIKNLIEQRFDAISEPSVPAQSNGHNDPVHDEPDVEADVEANADEITVQPPKKKQRKSASVGTEDADAKLAAMLQAEENSRGGRATRGGGAKAKPVKKRKKKSSAKVESGGSDVDEEIEPKKRKAGGGFQKPFNLSEPLAELTGESRLSRPQVVKKLWEYIKAGDLQDPSDKRQIRCDDKMLAVFKQAKIDMFQMNKVIEPYRPALKPRSLDLPGRPNSSQEIPPSSHLLGTPLSIIYRPLESFGSTDASNGPRHWEIITSWMLQPRVQLRQTDPQTTRLVEAASNANNRGGRPPRSRGRGAAGDRTGSRAGFDGRLTAAGSVQPGGSLPQPPPPSLRDAGAENGGGDDDDVETEVCFICASTVVHQSVAPCNHRTCHICALRMRALYKNKECAHCRTPAQYVIFTDDATKRFEDYSEGAPDITSTDENIGIRYNKEDIVGDTVLLLRYNCPDGDCDFAGLGWPDLHRHVRNVHHKKMCDLCTRNKKVFTHEHEVFTDKELERHMRHGDDRPGAVDQTGFKGHPLCAFCGQRFYDDDKLYEHCRNKHERCFLCDRADPREPHYYQDYNALEQHFREGHFLCPEPDCQEKKFVVFASEMDLKAHQLSEHANTLSKDVRRDARVVDLANFDLRQPYQDERRAGGSGRGRGGGRDRNGERGGRGRDPNSEPIPASSAQPLRRDELAFQRQMAIHSTQRTFGGHLTADAPTPAASGSTQAAQRNAPATSTPPSASTVAADLDNLSLTDPNLTQEQRAQLTRHAAVIERATGYLHNDKNKLDVFRAQISTFRQGKMTASALVDSFFTLFSNSSSGQLGTLVRELADLFEDKSKSDQLRKAWNDWRAINEDYPTLPGLGGMHGATTSSSGWANAAASSPVSAATAPSQKHSTRVLKLKSSTQQSRRSTATQSANWAGTPATAFSSIRPPPPAASFPALPPRSSTSTPTSRAAPSSSLGWGPGNTSTITTQHQPYRAGPSRSSAAGREDSFPALPTAAKPTMTIFGYGGGRAVRRDVGNAQGTHSWGGNGASNDTAEVAQEAETTGGKGKKKAKKQVLNLWA